jgi:hypothetical protein
LFPFTSMCIRTCTIFNLLSPFPTCSPSHWYHPPWGQDLFCPPVSDFAKEKKRKWIFCLFKIDTQGASLWHFHVYIYYSSIWFTSSIFLLSTFIPFLWLFQLV